MLNENLVLPGTAVGLMIVAWSHAVCFCRKPLAADGRELQAFGVRPAAEHHRECPVCDFVGKLRAEARSVEMRVVG